MTNDVSKLRAALANWKPSPHHDAVNPPDLKDIYTPGQHENALDPDRLLVVGDRGAGKSFWSACLLDETARQYVAQSYPSLGLERCQVVLGFGGVINSETAPSPGVLDQLEKQGFEPTMIWRAAVLKGLSSIETFQALPTSWTGKDGLVAWVSENYESAQELLNRADRSLTGKNQKAILLFDALDRSGGDWSTIRRRTKSLLRLLLELRSCRSIKPKIFMRIDQLEDRAMMLFPDASKLVTSKVTLEWQRADLYGLLFTLLANDSSASTDFRRIAAQRTQLALPDKPPVHLPPSLKNTEKTQEELFIGLAGHYMGKNARKGKTYSWMFNHLADAYGRVSPRTFLEAIRVAAEHSAKSESSTVLHYKGLQAGLKSASTARLEQLREEYLWIENALAPLADLKVPCNASELFHRWLANDTIRLIQQPSPDHGYLVPIEFESEGDQNSRTEELPMALLNALIRIGVAERRPDQRVNVPDIYRIAARLVKPGGISHRQ